MGLHADRVTGQLQAAVVRLLGRSLQATAHVERWLAAPLATSFAPHAPVDGRGPTQDRWALVETAARLVNRLTEKLPVDGGTHLAIGLTGFGQWSGDTLGRPVHREHLDAAWLARLTGWTVIDDFPARDLAHGGQGGPLCAVPLWFLAADPGIVPGKRNRLLLHVGPVTSAYLLPPRDRTQVPAQLLAWRAGPGQRLLALLAGTPAARGTLDPTGHLAAQGRCRVDWIDRWRQRALDPSQDPFLWAPDESIDHYLEAVGGPDVLRTVPLNDRLATAWQWIAQSVATTVTHCLPGTIPAGQVTVVGAGSDNGFFWGQLRSLLPGVEPLRAADLGLPNDAAMAASAALLAAMHVDQRPATTPFLTGCDAPRVLGRLNPGSPANWSDVIRAMADALPEKQTLRSAL